MFGKPRQSVARLVVLVAVVFAIAYVRYVLVTVADGDLTAMPWAILVAKTTVELIASTFGIAFVASAITFLLMRDPPGQAMSDDTHSISIV